MTIIEIEKPSDIKTVRFYKQLENIVKSGIKTSDVKLQLNFVVSDKNAKLLFSHFQVLKNKIAFTINTAKP